MAHNEMGFDSANANAIASGEPLSNPSGLLQFEVGTSLDQIEREVIMATLQHCHGCKRETAKTLGISVKTLYNRLHEYRRSGQLSTITPVFTNAPAFGEAVLSR